MLEVHRAAEKVAKYFIDKKHRLVQITDPNSNRRLLKAEMPKKKPFSGKQKKKQLQEKRDRKKSDGSGTGQRTNAGKYILTEGAVFCYCNCMYVQIIMCAID